MIRTITLRTKQILFISLLIFLFRYLYIDLLVVVEHTLKLSLVEAAALVFSNVPLILLSVIVDFYVIRQMIRKIDIDRQPFLFYSFELLFLLLLSSIAGGYVCREDFISGVADRWSWWAFTSLIIFLLNMFVTVFINIQHYNKTAQEQALEEEKRKTFQAVHDYNRLKRQLNPHFLFNSLNVLNSMIHSDPSRAGAFIQKLAKIYRYLLGQEEENTVTFLDEFSFATAYFELMRERFGDALELKIEVSDEVMRTPTIPCSIQIQIENAVKHNALEHDKPLCIEIIVEEEWIIVRNNLIPKIQMPESTGIGLASIEAQYLVVFNREIVIVPDPHYFIVKLPIIHNL